MDNQPDALRKMLADLEPVQLPEWQVALAVRIMEICERGGSVVLCLPPRSGLPSIWKEVPGDR